eukprot:15042021-Heterocapsa_arctica.AAC.1
MSGRKGCSWHGSIENLAELAKTISTHVTSLGSIKYGKDTKLSKTEVDMLKKFAPMWKEIQI